MPARVGNVLERVGEGGRLGGRSIRETGVMEKG